MYIEWKFTTVVNQPTRICPPTNTSFCWIILENLWIWWLSSIFVGFGVFHIVIWHEIVSVCLFFVLSHGFRWLVIAFTANRARTCFGWIHIQRLMWKIANEFSCNIYLVWLYACVSVCVPYICTCDRIWRPCANTKTSASCV